jgi:NitT/TauT family transport system substrate-binding protein
MAGKTRLTPLAKLLLVVAVVGVGYFGLVKSGVLEGLLPQPGENNNNNGGQEQVETGDLVTNKKDVINIGVVTWGGYAGGQYWNNGFKANESSRFFKENGFAVEFKLLDDFDASRDAFKSGDVDLLWCTIDAFPTEVEGLKAYEPQVVFQADWSRGGDAIVVRRGINSVQDLKGKTIAVAPMTPSHTFLIWLLEAGGLSTKDVKITEVPSAIDAADAFKGGSVDAAVVWSPDDADCVDKVSGAKVLQSTKNASNIIADVFIAKRSYIENNKERLRQLYEGWMKGTAEINTSDVAKRKAAKILAAGLNQPEDFCYDAINNVRLTTHGDNLNFFGLNREYNGVTGEALYNKMKVTYADLGYAPKNIKSYRLVTNTDVVSGANLNGVAGQEAEGKKTFTKVTDADKTKEAISTKQVSINFRSAEYKLDENSKYIIDKEFGDIAKAFSNARIRIEGNTDNVGNPENNKKLSYLRAQAVAQYLQSEYGFDADRFVIIGNGSEKPVADNNTPDGRSQNRRTSFELIAE